MARGIGKNGPNKSARGVAQSLQNINRTPRPLDEDFLAALEYAQQNAATPEEQARLFDAELNRNREMKSKPEYKTDSENYNELLQVARKLTKKEIKTALNQSTAMHEWAVRAYTQALKEKEGK